MSTARVKTIPFFNLLVKWIDNGTTYFNSIVAQMLNTVMQQVNRRFFELYASSGASK